jgi:LPS-assembly protein
VAVFACLAAPHCCAREAAAQTQHRRAGRRALEHLPRPVSSVLHACGQVAALYLQGDEPVYDTGGNRVIARGNVEIYYNNYILTADQVVYDQSANTLTAVGNVMLKEPNGNIVRADRYTLTDDFRDGFVQSLSIVAADDTRIAAERAIRRGGNTTVFINGRFTPCKSAGGMPPLWCISAATVIHDQQAATITYQDAQFELFGVPVLYTPYFSTPTRP